MGFPSGKACSCRYPKTCFSMPVTVSWIGGGQLELKAAPIEDVRTKDEGSA